MTSIFYQSVSNTTAVCPLNRGNCSGNRPFSFIGMTANAPPPLASQLTEMYCGLACMSVRPDGRTPLRMCYLDEVCVPGIPRNAYIIIALFLKTRSAPGHKLFARSVSRTFFVGRPKTCPASKFSVRWPVGRITARDAYGISTSAQNGLTFARMHWQIRIVSSGVY